jgi:restriction system protein
MSAVGQNVGPQEICIMALSLGLGLGIGMIASSGVPPGIGDRLAKSAERVTLVLTGLVIPEKRVTEGLLIRSTSAVWVELVRLLGADWSQAFEIPPEKWEEIVAGGLKRWGYDEVTLTPRSGDHGRDVIATKHGFGSMKILGSVKAYKPGHLVSYDDIRALHGVVSLGAAASKGLIATTSDFPPRLKQDPLLAPAIPTRLELLNGENLRNWLTDLADGN